jgi:hypothetical protein
MTGLFGDNFAFTDHTNDHLGFAPRSFSAFYEWGNESAISRLYGGIHYRVDIEKGVQQGRCVAARVLALSFYKAPFRPPLAGGGDGGNGDGGPIL